MNSMEEKQSQLPGPTAAPAPKGGRWRPVLLLAVLIAILVLAKVFNVGEKLGTLRDWLVTLGPWGPLVLLLIYIVAVVAALPGAAITIAAGALFGSGTLAAVIHPYPTQAEAIRQTGDLYNRTKLTPGVKRIFTKFLAWRR